jgi:hypothetical protein
MTRGKPSMMIKVGISTALTVGALAVFSATPAFAARTFGTMNDAGGVYWRSAPDWNTPVAQSGNGFYSNTQVSVSCYQLGAGNIPGSANRMWVKASVVSGSGSQAG